MPVIGTTIPAPPVIDALCEIPRLFRIFLLIPLSLATARSEISAFIERVWLLDEGLPHNVVHRTVQDSKGFLWVATANGLARFDGRDFKDYSPIFPDDFRQSVRDIDRTSDGLLVSLPAAGGIVFLKDGVAQKHPLSDALAGQQLFTVFIEPGGAIWTGGAALQRWHDGRLQTFGPEQGFNRRYGARYFFAASATGEVWVSMGSDLFCFKEDRLIQQPGDFGENVTLAPSRNGGVWVLGDDRLLLASEGGLQVVSSLADWKRISLHIGLMEDRNGVLWIVSRNHGLFRFEAGRLEDIPVSYQRLSSIMQDAEDNIWIATNGGGLLRLRPRIALNLPSNSATPAESTNSITESSDGALWLANRDESLVTWKNGRMQIVAAPAAAGRKFFIVCADHAGRIWASAQTGLYRFSEKNAGDIQRVSAIDGPIYALHCAQNGDLWVCAGPKKTGFFRDDVFHPVSPDDGGLEGRISAFAQDDSSRLWLATQEGALFEYRDGKLIRDVLYELKFAHRIHALHTDRDGSLWIGTRVGLVRKRGENYQLINQASGLPDDLIIQILEDDARRLWIGSRRGLYAVSLDDLNAVADGRSSRLGAFTMGRNEGVFGAYSFVSGPPTAVRSRTGMLWFATHRGVVGIDPSAPLPGSQPPRVYIDEVAIHGKPAAAVADDPIRISAKASSIEFRFAAINLSAPEKVRIRHRLAGLETDWTETTNQRSATYAQLPPGTYELFVTAGSQSGAWNDTPARLTLTVIPAWWQSWWFRSLALLSFTSIIVFGARHWSHRRLQTRLARLEQVHALDKERARIARDLHDDLGGSLTQIGLLAERVKRQAGHSDIEQPLSDLASRTRSITTELESIVWTVSPRNSYWNALAMFIASFATRFLRDAEISCAVENTGAVPDSPMPPEIQHHVLAIAKEAVNNVCKHSRATHAILTMGADNDFFSLALKDNGTGFNPGAAEHSERNGLANMQTRAVEIGATLNILSTPGNGSALLLRVPLKAAARPNSSA